MTMPSSKHDFAFDAEMNIEYHAELERRATKWQNLAAFASLVLSSAALVAVANWTQDPEAWLGSAAAVVALLNIYVLSFGLPDKAKSHAAHKALWFEFQHHLLQKDASFEDLLVHYNRVSANEDPANTKVLKRAYDKVVAIYNAEREQRDALPQ